MSSPTAEDLAELRKMYPKATDAELAIIQENFERYVALAIEACERIEKQPPQVN